MLENSSVSLDEVDMSTSKGKNLKEFELESKGRDRFNQNAQRDKGKANEDRFWWKKRKDKRLMNYMNWEVNKEPTVNMPKTSKKRGMKISKNEVNR